MAKRMTVRYEAVASRLGQAPAEETSADDRGLGDHVIDEDESSERGYEQRDRVDRTAILGEPRRSSRRSSDVQMSDDGGAGVVPLANVGRDGAALVF